MPVYGTEPNKLQNWNFTVKIPGVSLYNFRNIKGLKMDIEVIKYREGGDNHGDRKFLGRPNYEDITLEHGILQGDNQLYNMFKAAYDIKTNIGNEPVFNMIINQKNRQNITVRRWVVTNCKVFSYEGDDLDASANDINIERVVICHEGSFPM